MVKKVYKVQLVRKETVTYEVVAECSVDAEIRAKELYKLEAGYSGRPEFIVDSIQLVEAVPEVPPSQEVLKEHHRRKRRRT